MANNKTVTIKDLIAKKDKAKENKTAQLYVKSQDGLITIQKPPRDICLDALEMADEGGDDYLIYNSVIEPSLKDKELQEAYNCVTPTDIIGAIFEPGEIVTIAKEILVLAGYGDSVQLIEEIKKQ